MLAEKVKRLIAIELDPELYERLKGDFIAYRNVEIIHADALKFPFETIGEFKVVANIPYYITTPIIFRLLEAKEHLKSMTLTIQKEVAERIVSTAWRQGLWRAYNNDPIFCSAGAKVHYPQRGVPPSPEGRLCRSTHENS